MSALQTLEPPEELKTAVKTLFRLAAGNLRTPSGGYIYHTPEGRASVQELYEIFAGDFKGKLSNWRKATLDKDSPRAQINRTNDLLAIFDGSGSTNRPKLFRENSLERYNQLIAYWTSEHGEELSTVVTALREYRRIIDLKLSTRARNNNADALRGAIERLTATTPEAAAKPRSSLHRDGNIPELRVFQTEPPIGRDRDRDLSISDLSAQRGLVLFGAPGQGKTALARYIAITTASSYATGVYEIDLENERQIENLPRLIASALGHPNVPSSYEPLEKSSSLLILDGLDQILDAADPAKLRQSLRLLTNALSHASRVIITCQKRFEKEGFATREVKPLAREHALTLFHRFSQDLYFREDPGALAEFVTGDLAAHPLSVKIVGRYGSSLNLPFGDLKRLWKEKWLEIADESPSIDDRGLLTTFELTHGSLSQSEQLLFLTLALLPDGISTDLTKSVWPDKEIIIYEALRTLRNRSLLEDSVAIPTILGRLRGPLFRFAFAKKRQIENDQKDGLGAELRKSTTAIDGYFDTYVSRNAPQYTDINPRQKNDLIRTNFHNIHASLDRRLEPSIKAPTIAAAQSVLALYWAYHNNLSGANNPISSTDDATTYLRKAVDIFVANKMAEEAVRCRYYIGNILWLRGNIHEAQDYLKEIETSNETDEKIRCDSRRAFAHIEYKQGDINRSVELYRSVIQDTEQNGYELCTLKCNVGLIDAYRKLGEFDLGIKAFESIKDKMISYGGDLRGNALRGYAYCLAEKGDLDTAKLQYENALLEFEGVSLFGQAHCQRGLGDVFVKLGCYSDADLAFESAIKLYDEAQKNPSLGVGLVYLGRGRLELSRSNHNEAARCCRLAARLFDRQNQNEPYELAVAHELLGDVYVGIRKIEEARASYEIALACFTKVGATKVAKRLTKRTADL